MRAGDSSVMGGSIFEKCGREPSLNKICEASKVVSPKLPKVRSIKKDDGQ